MLPSFLPTTAPTAVRRPTFEVSFSGSSNSSPLGGLMSAASSVLGVDLGGSGDAWKRSVVAIVLETGCAPGVDVLEIELAADSEAPTVAVGDVGSLSLGYEDDANELVFTGQVEQIRYSTAGITRLTATNGGAALAKLRLNQSYAQQTAGDIVRDLTGRSDINPDTLEAGINFPFYVLDDRGSAYQHIATLAQTSGFLAYFTPAGKLKFASPNAGQPVQTFTFGTDILSLQVTQSAALVGSVTAIGDGAASSQGQNAWSWLIKDPASVTGRAGSGDPQRQLSNPALRSQNAAQQFAHSKTAAANRQTLSGRILVPGAPKILIGTTIAITNAPQPNLNNTFLVQHLCHHFSKHHGFTTLIQFTQLKN